MLTICELADLGEEAEVAVKSVSQGPPELKLPFYSGGEFEVQINGFENGLQIKIVATIEGSKVDLFYSNVLISIAQYWSSTLGDVSLVLYIEHTIQ